MPCRLSQTSTGPRVSKAGDIGCRSLNGICQAAAASWKSLSVYVQGFLAEVLPGPLLNMFLEVLLAVCTEGYRNPVFCLASKNSEQDIAKDKACKMPSFIAMLVECWVSRLVLVRLSVLWGHGELWEPSSTVQTSRKFLESQRVFSYLPPDLIELRASLVPQLPYYMLPRRHQGDRAGYLVGMIWRLRCDVQSVELLVVESSVLLKTPYQSTPRSGFVLSMIQ